MEIHQIKARMKQLQEELAVHKASRQSALAEASASGNGLVGDVLASFNRADAAAGRIEPEIDALNQELQAARGKTTIVDPGSGEPTARMNRRLERDQSFGDIHGEGNDIEGLATYLRNVALGAESRVQSTVSDPAGGFVVPDILSTTLWDLARDKTVARDAGVSFIPLDGAGGNWALPKITGDAVPTWTAENAQIAEDDMTFGQEELTPKKLALMVRASRELIQDSSQDIADVVVRNVTDAFAREIDRVIFNGSGAANEPLGIRNFSGIPEMLTVGTPNWSTLSDAALAIREANYEPGSLVLAPRDERTLTEQRIDQGGGAGTGVYLNPPSTVSGISRFATNAVDTDLGAGTDESWGLMGDFSQAIVGVRLDLMVRPLTERYADFDQVGWAFGYRMDLTVMRTAAFMKLEGITA